MKGKAHRNILNNLLPFAAFVIGYYHYAPKYALVFWVLWKIGTYTWQPDRDLQLPFFKHRGILHSFWMWAVVGIAGYYFIGWWSLGLPLAQEVHILSDKVSDVF
jgi:uncharacterized metal-binding protein